MTMLAQIKEYFKDRGGAVLAAAYNELRSEKCS